MLWNEVELLQQENLRLRSVLKGYKSHLDERLSLKSGQADVKPDTLTVGKYKRAYLQKKVSKREGRCKTAREPGGQGGRWSGVGRAGRGGVVESAMVELTADTPCLGPLFDPDHREKHYAA